MLLALIIVSMLLTASVIKNIQFAIHLLKMEDAIEEALDVIEEKYAHMSEILKRPLFFDSPEIKSVVRDLSEVKKILHKIAIVLTTGAAKESESIDQS
jgi:uncharacterized membrane protein